MEKVLSGMMLNWSGDWLLKKRLIVEENIKILVWERQVKYYQITIVYQ